MEVFLELLKTDFYVFALFTKFLVTKFFIKHIIKCEIEIHVGAI
jgi:hypothetical protein